MWVPVPEKEHLFKKQLSKHSIGAYMELCRGVGVPFEAIAQPRSDTEGIIEKNTKVKRNCFQSLIPSSASLLTL
jgi:hypothetical protein